MLRFGDCRLDLETRQLLRGDREVHLTPKAFELLRVLIARRPAAIAKSELLASIWPDTFVSESNLARVVSEVRRAVGEIGSSDRLIRTVHAFGYAFWGEVSEESRDAAPASLASCWLVLGGRAIPLSEGTHIVGRDPEARPRLDWPTVSRHHARIDVVGGEARVQDVGSKNGTYLRGTRIEESVRLADGDQLRFGSVEVLFRAQKLNAEPTEPM